MERKRSEKNMYKRGAQKKNEKLKNICSFKEERVLVL